MCVCVWIIHSISHIGGFQRSSIVIVILLLLFLLQLQQVLLLRLEIGLIVLEFTIAGEQIAVFIFVFVFFVVVVFTAVIFILLFILILLLLPFDYRLVPVVSHWILGGKCSHNLLTGRHVISSLVVWCQHVSELVGFLFHDSHRVLLVIPGSSFQRLLPSGTVLPNLLLDYASELLLMEPLPLKCVRREHHIRLLRQLIGYLHGTHRGR